MVAFASSSILTSLSAFMSACAEAKKFSRVVNLQLECCFCLFALVQSSQSQSSLLLLLPSRSLPSFLLLSLLSLRRLPLPLLLPLLVQLRWRRPPLLFPSYALLSFAVLRAAMTSSVTSACVFLRLPPFASVREMLLL